MTKLKTLTLGTGLALAAALTLSSCGDSKPGDSKGGASAPSAAAPSGDTETIKIEFPKPMFQGTPLPAGDPLPNLEKTPRAPVDSIVVPKGTTNVALKKKVTSDDAAPVIPGPNALELITDGDADSSDGCFAELKPGPTWVQIDLGGEFNVHKLAVWHYHRQTSVVVKAVVVQVSDDPEMKKDVTTVYNADMNNECGQGKGEDLLWVQTNCGRVIDGKSAKGRYVRLWSNGNTQDDFNRYIEVSVYGTPAK